MDERIGDIVPGCLLRERPPIVNHKLLNQRSVNTLLLNWQISRNERGTIGKMVNGQICILELKSIHRVYVV